MTPTWWMGVLGRSALEGGLLMLGVWAVCRLRPGLPAWARAGLWWLSTARLLIGLLPLAAVPIRSPLPVTTVWWPAAMAANGPVTPGAPIDRAPTVEASAGVLGEPVTAAPVVAAPALPVEPARPPFDWSWLPLGLCLIWALGVVVRLTGLGLQFRRVHRARAAALPVADEVAGGLGVPVTERLAISALAPVPMVTGLIRPVVLLPEQMMSRPRSEVRLAVAHEIAHVRRGDLWFAWVPALAETLFWFHPLVPMAVREYVQACEESCDEEALHATGASPYDYGRLLLALGVHRRFSGATAMPCGSPSPRQLTRRLSMLEFFDPLKPRMRRAAVGLLCAFALVGLAPLRVVPISAAPRPDPTPGAAEHSTTLTVAVTTDDQAVNQPAPEESGTTTTESEDWKAPEPDPAEDSETPEAVSSDEDDAENAEDADDADDEDDADWEDEDTPPTPPQPAKAPRAVRTPRAPHTPRPRVAPVATRAPRAPRSSISFGYETGDERAERFAYVMVRAHESSMSGSGNTADWKEVRRLKQELGVDFLWVRIDGDRRVIVDPEVLAQVDEALAPMSEVGERQSRLGEAQSKIGERQSEIGEEQAKIGEKQARIGEQQARLAERMVQRSKTRDADEEFERLNEELAEQMEELGRMQERLGSRMEPLAQQQSELGAQMEVLAREMERVSRRSQRQVRSVIERAIRDGKARSVR